MNDTAAKEHKDAKTSVLLVNSSAILLRGLVQIINQEPDMVVCAEVADPAQAVKAIAAGKPDIVLVDVSIKGGGGVDLIKQIRQANPHLSILVLSMHDESFYAEYVLRAGANGYITMHQSGDHLVSAIRKTLEAGMYVDERIAEGIVSRFVDNHPAGDSPMRFFSEREFEVFEYLGQGLSVRQIAEKLHRSVKTVEAHRENIKKKLRVTNTTELLRNAIHWVEYRRET